jgi:hypothetical protein
MHRLRSDQLNIIFLCKIQTFAYLSESGKIEVGFLFLEMLYMFLKETYSAMQTHHSLVTNLNVGLGTMIFVKFILWLQIQPSV